MTKTENYNKFKAIAGVTFVVVLLISFLNILSSENEDINLYDIANKFPVDIQKHLKTYSLSPNILKPIGVSVSKNNIQ